MQQIINPLLSELCSIRIGGTGSVLYLPQSLDDLREVAALLNQDGAMLCGWGCNMVFPEKLDRPLIKLSAEGFGEMSVQESAQAGNVLVDAGGGCGLGAVLAFCQEKGIGGLEALAGIPASIGGAVAMNAGAHGRSIGDVVESVRAFSVEEKREYVISKDEMQFAYRSSIVQGRNLIVTGVRLALRQSTPQEVADRMQEYSQKRITGKIRYPNCGSVFKNPLEGEPAGKFLDLCGFKGKVSGGLQVSALHANIFENHGGATCADFVQLCTEVQTTVRKRFGFELQTEVKIISG